MTNHMKLLMISLSTSLLFGCVQGQTGLQGVPGNIGAPGPAGSSCTTITISPNSVAPNGGAEIECEDGTSALLLNGINGVNGTNGTNSAISPIQFCPGTPSYPSDVFPEVGFCINNSIYAVYSANGGFLTEVLPGNWSSDGINSSCNFTVLPNCVITNN
jgi:hypothetical protein